MSKILAFSGSARKESFNQRMVAIAARGAEAAGADVTLVNLADYPMPIFDQDLEADQGIPEEALAFKQLMIEADGFLIASPEYNSAFSPLLKNAIDWASRAASKEESPMLAYKNKAAAIMAASPGGLGGMRGLVFLRMLLGNLGVLVIPEQQTLPSAFKAFNEDGSLVDSKKQEAVAALGLRLTQVCGL